MILIIHSVNHKNHGENSDPRNDTDPAPVCLSAAQDERDERG